MSGTAVTTTSHNSIIPHQPPPPDGTTPSRPLEPQASSPPKTPCQPDILLQKQLDGLARTKTLNALSKRLGTSSDIVERLLWRRVLEARIKLMQDQLLLNDSARDKDHEAPPVDLQTDIDQHSKSAAFQDQTACRQKQVLMCPCNSACFASV